MANEELKELIREEGKWIKIFLGKETQTDPFEKSVSIATINPIPIRGLVTDLVASQTQYKMPGIRTEQGKEIIIPSSKRTLIEQSHRIEIDGDKFMGWRDNNGKMQIRQEGNYIRILVFTETNK